MSVQKLLTFHLQLSKQIVAQQGPETQRLYLGRTMLEDARQLAELKVENDDVIALTYQQGGTLLYVLLFNMCVRTLELKEYLHADGSWEDVNIAEYVPEMEITGHS